MYCVAAYKIDFKNYIQNNDNKIETYGYLDGGAMYGMSGFAMDKNLYQALISVTRDTEHITIVFDTEHL